ncbi:AAA family ATPase [Thermosulfurimonas dismutans]|uniref:Uncharacterized protein n=1 Tax=Thermosulfurimonas dismutans TaxID=999894 RepID=A0A179D3C8_9BACT|nr:AAA family ATPase [Thermosulfurimonas dismutans]OAQ19972.1 hypothetical protein TDIS_1971 [Thermosulfurimonas dismutans]
MKIKRIHIHNFRSIKDVSIELENYSLLIGENNAGKTNIMRALRVFYDDLKYDPKKDWPKFNDVSDDEAWIEIKYLTTDEEQAQLKKEYRSNDNILKVRKILKTNKEPFKSKVKANQSNIFAYENETLSENFFYGAKNISQSKLGTIIYIPEISKIEESIKMTGPSPLRNILHFVIKKIIEKSESYASLRSAFEDFNKNFKEESIDGISLANLTEEINKELKEWNVKFGLDINPIRIDDIIAKLVSHYIEDSQLDDQRLSIDSFGQGLQRHLIYTLIKLSTKYTDTPKTAKKDFSPDFTLILFEEPEAFLHPSQQEKLNISLAKLAEDESQQILITTHSPMFVSKNISNISSLIKVNRDKETKTFQIKKEEIDSLYDENTSMFQFFLDKLNSQDIGDELKQKIRKRNLARETDNVEIKLKEESFKYFLWLDSERSNLFFAKHVVICEGATEKIFFDYLINTKWSDLKDRHIYFLDSMGKFNVHRYMNLFNLLGINHSVLIDRDKDIEIHDLINSFIEDNKNEFTCKIHYFDPDIEGFLGIEKPKDSRQKPLNIMVKYSEGQIPESKINELRAIIEGLLKHDQNVPQA